MKHIYTSFAFISFFLISFLTATQSKAQGTWMPVFTPSPDSNGGGMLLLSDGRVMVKTEAGGGDGIGNTWNVLTPDINGSYVAGTWSTIAPMHGTRLYYSSQVLKDGRVYAAGGEYGTGYASSEIYDPLTNAWKLSPVSHDTFYDANSNMLPDGRVLQQLLMGNFLTNAIFDPITSTYSPAGNCHGYASESTWLQLPDYSILFIDLESKNSERYIPSLNKWLVDATVPDSIWQDYETGGSLLLPNGKGFFFGASGHTAYYTPSGNNSPGVWTAGPDFPNGNGTADAPAAIMVNGKVLCMGAPVPTSDSTVFLSPTTFYEFNYLTNSFKIIPAPFALDTNTVNFVFNMLNLPDGTVMLSEQGSRDFYVYTPDSVPMPAGKPSIDSIVEISCGTYLITGELFNGLSQGSTYNDDFQSATNYPVIRLTSGSKVYYARTYNWNSIGVMTDSLQDSAYFTLPAGLPEGSYSLVVTANGIASNPVTFTPCILGVQEVENKNSISVYPNPSNGIFNLTIRNYELGMKAELEVYNVLSEKVYQSVINTGTTHIDISNEASGVYMYRIVTKTGALVEDGKLVVEQ